MKASFWYVLILPFFFNCSSVKRQERACEKQTIAELKYLASYITQDKETSIYRIRFEDIPWTPMHKHFQQRMEREAYNRLDSLQIKEFMYFNQFYLLIKNACGKGLREETLWKYFGKGKPGERLMQKDISYCSYYYYIPIRLSSCEPFVTSHSKNPCSSFKFYSDILGRITNFEQMWVDVFYASLEDNKKVR